MASDMEPIFAASPSLCGVLGEPIRRSGTQSSRIGYSRALPYQGRGEQGRAQSRHHKCSRFSSKL